MKRSKIIRRGRQKRFRNVCLPVVNSELSPNRNIGLLIIVLLHIIFVSILFLLYNLHFRSDIKNIEHRKIRKLRRNVLSIRFSSFGSASKQLAVEICLEIVNVLLLLVETKLSYDWRWKIMSKRKIKNTTIVIEYE